MKNLKSIKERIETINTLKMKEHNYFFTARGFVSK